MSQAAAGIPRYRAFDGPILFRQGFRPFFLGAGIWAFVAMSIWLPTFTGLITLPTAFDPVLWHAHELLFGFVTAAIAGFLLTAIPNWTGRMPLQGWPLAAIFGLWGLGRLAVTLSALIGPTLAAFLDLAFLAVLLGIVLREILTGRNWRNLPIPVALAAIFCANAFVHAEAIGFASTGALGLRLAIATIVVLISLIGGRIIPSFTRNYLRKRGGKSLPVAFDIVDRLCLLAVVIACLSWTLAPDSQWTATALLVAGLATLARLARWRGQLVLGEAMLWSLHLAFAWLGLGLLLLAQGISNPNISTVAGVHVLTIGAMGTMTLAVMTRAILRQVGMEAIAGRWTTAIFAFVSAATVFRFIALDPPNGITSLPYLWDAGLFWLVAFAIFAFRYGRLVVFSEQP